MTREHVMLESTPNTFCNLFAGYSLFWIFVFVFVLLLLREQRSLLRKLNELNRS